MHMKVYSRVQNQSFRDKWVDETLRQVHVERALELGTPNLIDVGAGQKPYESLSKQIGYEYYSHDFNKYSPSEQEIGLHVNWPHLNHDFNCDILEIPSATKFDVVLCTEVLEHVPNPVATIRHLASLLKPGGFMIITAPLISLVHQAPFHFSSGLTSFWYKHWMDSFGIQVVEISQHGDYSDLISQEFRRMFFLPSVFQKPLAFLFSVLNKPRKTLNSSGGFSIFAVGKKP